MGRRNKTWHISQQKRNGMTLKMRQYEGVKNKLSFSVWSTQVMGTLQANDEYKYAKINDLI
jgi:hypothetical protein